MRVRKTVGMDTGMDIHFWAPHASWQRIINKITKGLLGQYFAKGTDVGIHGAVDLDSVAAELNHRPCKRLPCSKPVELIELPPVAMCGVISGQAGVTCEK